jgi:hypothetical protein
MNKLWVFGDSYSVPFSKIGDSKEEWARIKRDYITWKEYIPKCYGEIVSDKLQLKNFNLAIGGSDNYTIFNSIISMIETINTDDVIIIGWSSTLRFRVVNKDNNFKTIRPNNLKKLFELNKESPFLELSDSTLTELVINRDSSIYIDELNNYIKLLNFSFKKNKIIHWSPFGQDKDGLLTTSNSLNNLELIVNETKGKVNDSHFSENAHYELAEHFIDTINSYEYPTDKKYI